MSIFDGLITGINEAETYNEKTQLLTALVRGFSQKRSKLSSIDRDTIGVFAMSEVSAVFPALEAAETYRQKDELHGYAHSLLELIILCYGSPEYIPDGHMDELRELGETLNRERFLERAVNEVFEGGKPSAQDFDRLICMAAPLKDEYHKGMLYQGLVHYLPRLGSLPADAAEPLARYTASEMRRYLDDPTIPEAMGNLELMSDVCRYFLTDELADLLTRAVTLDNTAIQYYAIASLLKKNRPVADEAIVSLAHEREYAALLYSDLKAAGQESRFPAELSNDAYIAESDMVHWLLYPTELGKEPDAIELLGVTKKKGETFHVFRYKSDSDNLSDELKGEWLIGWSGNDGSTFSNFDLYEPFVKKTPEKTLRHIRRKLL